MLFLTLSTALSWPFSEQIFVKLRSLLQEPCSYLGAPPSIEQNRVFHIWWLAELKVDFLPEVSQHLSLRNGKLIRKLVALQKRHSSCPPSYSFGFLCAKLLPSLFIRMAWRSSRATTTTTAFTRLQEWIFGDRRLDESTVVVRERWLNRITRDDKDKSFKKFMSPAKNSTELGKYSPRQASIDLCNSFTAILAS